MQALLEVAGATAAVLALLLVVIIARELVEIRREMRALRSVLRRRDQE